MNLFVMVPAAQADAAIAAWENVVNETVELSMMIAPIPAVEEQNPTHRAFHYANAPQNYINYANGDFKTAFPDAVVQDLTTDSETFLAGYAYPPPPAEPTGLQLIPVP